VDRAHAAATTQIATRVPRATRAAGGKSHRFAERFATLVGSVVRGSRRCMT
jgi:hypothetical protein